MWSTIAENHDLVLLATIYHGHKEHHNNVKSSLVKLTIYLGQSNHHPLFELISNQDSQNAYCKVRSDIMKIPNYARRALWIAKLVITALWCHADFIYNNYCRVDQIVLNELVTEYLTTFDLKLTPLYLVLHLIYIMGWHKMQLSMELSNLFRERMKKVDRLVTNFIQY